MLSLSMPPNGRPISCHTALCPQSFQVTGRWCWLPAWSTGHALECWKLRALGRHPLSVSFTASGIICSAPSPLPEARGDGEGAGLLAPVEGVWAGQAHAAGSTQSPFSSKDGFLTLSLLFQGRAGALGEIQSHPPPNSVAAHTHEIPSPPGQVPS